MPKDLTCAVCHGCGRKSYYLADGNPVREHKVVRGVFYCSATCMEVDEVTLRAEVNFATKGVWNPTRPPTGEFHDVNRPAKPRLSFAERGSWAPEMRPCRWICALPAAASGCVGQGLVLTALLCPPALSLSPSLSPLACHQSRGW